MNSQEKILLDISAFVDNQLLSPEERISVKKQIDENPDLAFEFRIQNVMKNLVSTRIDRAKTPAYLIENIVSKTIDAHTNGSTNRFISKVKELLTAPKYVLTAASLIVTIGIIYSLFNLNTPPVLNTPNMYTQAEQNFSSIITGDLKPQKLCKTSTEVQEFFRSAGVNYNTIVPEFAEWDLVGAVVSDEQGHKLAHHVYADDSGHLIYVYQVNKAHFGSNKLLELSPEVYTNLMENKVVKIQSTNHSSFLLKCDSNIFAIVSNDDDSKIEENFISNLVQRNTI